jgi:hypothetical protein
MAASTTASIEIHKRSPYEGGTHEWSNRYHFAGGVPGSLSEWQALSAHLQPYEVACFSPRTTAYSAVCRVPGTDVPVQDLVISWVGTFAPAPAHYSPLECCALIKWTTDQRSVKNHPIYLFQYMHDALLQDPNADVELLQTDQRSNILQYADAWAAGFSVGGNTLKRAGPRGAVGLTASVHTHITHRDFPA